MGGLMVASVWFCSIIVTLNSLGVRFFVAVLALQYTFIRKTAYGGSFGTFLDVVSVTETSSGAPSTRRIHFGCSLPHSETPKKSGFLVGSTPKRVATHRICVAYFITL